MHTLIRTSAHVGIRRPVEEDGSAFIAMVLASRQLHRPWVDPPDSAARFSEYLKSRQSGGDEGFLICACDGGQLGGGEAGGGAIVGVVNLNCIVRGAFRSAYLGYYIHAAFARRGWMAEGLRLVIEYAFSELGLHRLEANIQPGNRASIALVKRCGFHQEGFSPRYLHIAGEWRDHERWGVAGR